MPDDAQDPLPTDEEVMEEAADLYALVTRGRETMASIRCLITVPPSAERWLRTRSGIPEIDAEIDEAIGYRARVLAEFARLDRLAHATPNERRSEKIRALHSDPAWRAAHSQKVKDWHARRRDAAQNAISPATPHEPAQTDAPHLSEQTAA